MHDQNLLQTFFRVAEERKDKPFLWAKIDGSYQPWTWSEVRSAIQAIANALSASGIERGDRVVLVAENRPEWLISDLAILQAGGITVPAYTTNTVQDHRYILQHCSAKGVICSTAQLAQKLIPAVSQCPAVQTALFIEDPQLELSVPHKLSSWSHAIELGKASQTIEMTHELEPDDTACLIYTSGTGGNPKGVMLSHRNILANVRGAAELLRMVKIDEEDVFLSFLPLSHSYEHTAGQFFPMAIGAQIYYAEGIETLSANLLEARPTVLPCVPRLYEVLRQRIMSGAKRQGGIKAKLFDKAIELGARRYHQGSLPIHLDLVDRVLSKLVRKKVNQRFGGRLKAMISGGAPLNFDVGLFFVSLGLPVLQGYGQTEAAPVISANVPGKARIDTVGPPLLGVDVKIADDGEILVRGENVMKGYWEDSEATSAALIDGWLHTGDIGNFDENGFLKITDRKKDIIVNSGGDNISPQRIEGMLMLEQEIAQALVIGDKRPYLVALIVPDQDIVKSLRREHGDESDMAIKKSIGEVIKRANASLSPIERIRRYEIMSEPFSVENGMMTPTMKLRRPIIIDKHLKTLDKLYGAA